MAESTQKVLTIDTGNAITSVKEFKARIEELKGSLLGLEKGTEEYNAVAQELRDSQEKLTEVMDIAKGKAEGVEGSYDNLVATMRQLKTEWRATADETTRADLGQQILAINNQLKELDASTGNFQRNVGDYANAFEEAFKNVLQGIGASDSALGKTSQAIVRLIPLIKKATTAATVGLSGIKKAIVATGIGALVVAVGTLAANWDKVKNVVAGMFGHQKNLTNEIRNSVTAADELKRKYDAMNDSLDFSLRLMQAQGATNAEVLKFQETELTKQYGDALALLSRYESQYANRKNAWDFTEKENKALQDQIAAQKEIVSNIGKQIDQNRQNQQIEEARAATAQREREKAEADAKKNSGGSTTKTKSDAEQRKEDELKRIAEIQKALEDAQKTELEKLEETYNEQKALFERHGADTTELTKKFHKDYLALVDKYNQERLDEIEEQSARERQEMLEEVDKTIQALKEKAKQDIVKVQFELEEKNLKENSFSKLEKFFGKDYAFDLDNITGVFDNRQEAVNKIYEIQRAELEAEKNQLEELQSNLDPRTEEYANAQTRLAEIAIETDNLKTENAIENLNITDEREQALSEARKRRMSIYSEGLQSIGDLINSIGGIMEEQITAEVENGRISEKTAKARFESVKKMQIGSAIINMAAGVVSAIAQAQELGPVMGPIMAAINSAAVIAAGTIQISQIRRQQYGSNSSSSSVSTPDLQRATNMVQIQPVQNITGQNETTELANAINSKPIVVKVSDIEDTEQIVNSTKVESTF